MTSLRAPDYERGPCRMWLGDCRDILPHLSGVDAVVTDPPYGESMGFDGDENPRDAAILTGEVFALLRLAVHLGGYSACFWTMRSLDYLLDAVRDSGWSYCRTLAMHVAGTARPHMAWLPRLQPIALCRNGAKSSDLHDMFSVWLKERIEASGLSCSQIALALGVDSRLIMKWSRYRDPSWCLPTIRHYPQLKELLSLTDDFDDELMNRQRDEGRDYNYRHDLYQVTAGTRKSEHPAEKPTWVVAHICESLSMQDGTVLDPFMGSGTTGVACIRTGRKFIGIEKEPKYFDIAVKRIDRELDQPRLFPTTPEVQQQAELFSDGD